MTTPKWTLKLEPIAGVGTNLIVDVTVDHYDVWVAQIRGEPGCIGDGQGKMEAVQNAVLLFLHVLVMKIQRGRLVLRLVKQPDS